MKIGEKYASAIISTKLMRFTVLYTATIKGGKHLLRKSNTIAVFCVGARKISDSVTSHGKSEKGRLVGTAWLKY